MSSGVLSVAEVEAKYDRPLWAASLGCMRCSGCHDHTPYYWVDGAMTTFKRVTSKRKLNNTVSLSDLKAVAFYDVPHFNLPFFEELRQANMLED